MTRSRRSGGSSTRSSRPGRRSRGRCPSIRPAAPGPRRRTRSCSRTTTTGAASDLMPDEGSWSAQDTTPGAIESALRELLKEQHAKSDAYVPARVLNMVAVVDREWRGEIYNRLEGVGRYHASRTILCAVERGRQAIDAWVTVSADQDPRPGEIALTHERVVLDVGPQHLKALDTVVDPLLISDIATVCWAPHGHTEAVDALLHLTQVVLRDSVQDPDPA